MLFVKIVREVYDRLNDSVYPAVQMERKRWPAAWESTVSDEGRRAVMGMRGCCRLNF